MSDKKLTRQQLREPDEFAKRGTEFLNWCGEHFNQLLIGALVLFLLAGALIYGLYRLDKINQRAAFMFAEAQKIYNKPMPMKSVARAMPAGKDGGAATLNMAGATNSVDEERFNKQMLEAAEKFAEVQKNFPNSKVTPLATLYQGISLQTLGENDKAIPLLERGLKDSQAKGSLYWLARQRLGVSYFGLSQFEPALEQLGPLAASPENPFRDQALYYAGLTLLKLGRIEEAQDNFTQIEQMEPPSFLAEQAKQKMPQPDLAEQVQEKTPQPESAPAKE